MFILKALTDKKGNWATIRQMMGTKDANFVRSTIKQIEDRFPDSVKKHIQIISTQGEETDQKPDSGAYRIKVIQ
jgi:hypothetical protein